MKDKSSTLDNGTIEIYSDGAASPNPGNGGYGVVIRYLETKDGEPVEVNHEFSRGFNSTTNNRMEMMGARDGISIMIRLFKDLPEATRNKFKQVKVISDSSLLCNGFTKGWVKKWGQTNWITSTQQPVKNVDLWQDLIRVTDILKFDLGLHWHFIHVPGHKGYIFNEKCDKLAVAARQSSTLEIDQVYENLAVKG